MAALRIRLPSCVAWAVLALASIAARADPALTLHTRIGAQPLAAVLADFARQTGMQVVYSSALVEGRKSRGARAGFDSAALLRTALSVTPGSSSATYRTS